jgi:hypothetical protein
MLNLGQTPRTRWLIILEVLIFAAAIFGSGYAYEQSTVTSDLKMQSLQMPCEIAQGPAG